MSGGLYDRLESLAIEVGPDALTASWDFTPAEPEPEQEDIAWTK